MMTKRTLIAVAFLGALVAGVFVYANTRPAIPADKLEPDLDPATATPEEWRAEAERIINEVTTLASSLPTASPQQIREKNSALHLCALLNVRVGDTARAMTQLSAIGDPAERSRVFRAIAYEPAAIGQTETVAELLAAAWTDIDAAQMTSALAFAYARANDPQVAENVLADPRFQSDELDRINPNRRLMPLGEIADAYARTDKHDEAKRIAREAERILIVEEDPRIRHLRQMNIAEMYIAGRDPDSALRIIDDATDGFRVDELLSDIAKTQAIQGDLERARLTRERIQNLFLRVYAFSNAAEELALSGQTEVAEDLFAQADDVHADEFSTADRVFLLTHLTELQYRSGLGAQANETADRVVETLATLPPSPAKAAAIHDLLEVLIEAAQPEAAQTLFESLVDVFEALEPDRYDEYSLQTKIADAASQLGLNEEAEERFATATAAAMSEPDLLARIEQLRHIAVTQSGRGHTDEASKTFDLAISALSQLNETNFNRAAKQLSRYLAETGRVTAAIYIAEMVEDPFDRFMALDRAGSILAWRAERLESESSN